MRAGLGKTNIRDTIKKREHIGISFDEIEAAVKRHMHVPNFCVLDSLSNHPSTHDIFKGKDIAFILVRGKFVSKEWHWMCYPVDKDIKTFFGPNTVIDKVLLLRKANG